MFFTKKPDVIYLYLCVWSSEDTLGSCVSGPIHLVFWNRVSYWPGTHQVGHTGCPGSPRDPPSLHLDFKCTPLCLVSLCTWFPGVEVRSQCLHGKHVTDWAMSTILDMRIKSNFIKIIITFDCVCVCVCTFTWVKVCTEARSGCQSLWSWNSQQLWDRQCEH